MVQTAHGDHSALGGLVDQMSQVIQVIQEDLRVREVLLDQGLLGQVPKRFRDFQVSQEGLAVLVDQYQGDLDDQENLEDLDGKPLDNQSSWYWFD